ncbi:MAG TPA: hypothetical protein ENH62_05775 [Marinobacter sp.]|nr:hypothetical protein [Marinobacter sp.]
MHATCPDCGACLVLQHGENNELWCLAVPCSEHQAEPGSLDRTAGDQDKVPLDLKPGAWRWVEEDVADLFDNARAKAEAEAPYVHCSLGCCIIPRGSQGPGHDKAPTPKGSEADVLSPKPGKWGWVDESAVYVPAPLRCDPGPGGCHCGQDDESE